MSDAMRGYLVERCKKLMFVKLSEDHIIAAQSRNGGWSEEQLALVGVAWPPAPGWKDRIRHKRFPGGVVASFIELRDAHLSTAPDEPPSLF